MSNFTVAEFDRMTNVLIDEYREAIKVFTQAKNAARIAEEGEKPLLADLMRELEGGVEARRWLAYGDRRYRETHLKGKHQALFEADKAWYHLKVIERRLDFLQSRFSLARTVMASGG